MQIFVGFHHGGASSTISVIMQPFANGWRYCYLLDFLRHEHMPECL